MSKERIVEEYRELDEAEGEHGPEAAEVGVREEAAEEGEEEDGAHEVGHYVGRLRQREVHLPEHVRDEVVPHRRDRHDLERLDACTSASPVSTRARAMDWMDIAPSLLRITSQLDV